MKFIADSMLGRLAKWLRILGYDTLYYTDIDDSLLLRIAREEGRTLLTRDTRLIKVKGLKDFIFIYDDNPADQLRQLFKAGVVQGDRGLSQIYGQGPHIWGRLRIGTVPEANLLSRCVHCNSILYSIPSNKAEGTIPDFALWKEEVVRQCPSCGRIYWKGTHLEKIKERLKEVFS
ncbi:MAG: Mut7-C RNAse domain-containing protein [Nitrospirae bacterium]|nr:Mut7-C RNAse domain-containing protein [Nitrospirota bacterium]